jgi:large repetitive protein
VSALNLITVTASGGTGVLTYSIDGQAFQPSGVFSNMQNGSYTLTVRDERGCTATTTAVVAVPTVVATVRVVQRCAGPIDSIIVQGAGGIPPYTYALNGGAFQPGNVFVQVPLGPIEVRVRDAVGTIAMATAPTVQVPPVVVVADVVGNDIVALSTTGGTPPYAYAVNGIAVPPGGIMNLPNGTYTVLVTASNGCTGTTSVTINYTPPVVSATQLNNPGCFGSSNGSAVIAVSNGVPPFVYSLNGGAFQSAPPTTGLAAGTYTLTVRDQANTQVNFNFTLQNPPLLQVNAQVNGDTVRAAQRLTSTRFNCPTISCCPCSPICPTAFIPVGCAMPTVVLQ